jgi:Phosphotransferase enzyme family
MDWSPTRVSPGACSATASVVSPRPSPDGAIPRPSPDGPLDGPDGPLDGPLDGGTANRGLVVRVGATVTRPLAPCWPATHALLAHLAAAGFDGAPRVLATGHGTERLSYIPGQAGVPPLAPDMLTDAALISIAELVRSYHAAAAGFDPSGYQWPRPVPDRFRGGLVSHNDVHPANVVFRDGRAVALIDFDLAGPGSAVWDFAAAARYWAPLYDERDVTDSRAGRALERFRLFLAATGLALAGRREIAEAIVANHDWTYAIVTEAAAAGHRGFADHWRSVAAPATRARRWCVRHRRDLFAAAR